MKLRVISGKLGGRQFASPSGHSTHPMSERARGAIFNVLGDISNLRVVDTFGGSGALGFEACSRGAKHATVIELDKGAYETITENIRELDLVESVNAVRANVISWQKRNKDITFDLVFCDPPYDKINYASLMKLAELAKVNGIIVYSMPNDHDFRLPPDQFKLLSEKKYAGASLAFYKKIR